MASTASSTTIRIRRYGDLSKAAAIAYWTTDDTALAGTHYVAQNGTLSLSPYQVSASFDIPITPNPAKGRVASLGVHLQMPGDSQTPVKDARLRTLGDGTILLVDPTFDQPHRFPGFSIVAHTEEPSVLIGEFSDTIMPPSWQPLFEESFQGGPWIFSDAAGDLASKQVSQRFYRVLLRAQPAPFRDKQE